MKYPRWANFTKKGYLFQLTVLEVQGLMFNEGFLEGKVLTSVGHQCQIRERVSMCFWFFSFSYVINFGESYLMNLSNPNHLLRPSL